VRKAPGQTMEITITVLLYLVMERVSKARKVRATARPATLGK
jgi:hypothetical protein